MKQKDIALILIIAFISMVFSVILSNVLISSPKSRNQTAEVVSKITPEFNQPDQKYFNQNSVNPTKVIRIGDSANTKPFGQ